MSEAEWREWYVARRDEILRQISRLDTLIEIAKEKETTKDMAAEYSWTKASLGYIRDAFEILNYLRLHVYQHEQSHVEIKNRLANLDKEIQTTEADFTKSLKAIREWMRTYQPTLDEATKDYADKLGRATQLER